MNGWVWIVVGALMLTIWGCDRSPAVEEAVEAEPEGQALEVQAPETAAALPEGWRPMTTEDLDEEELAQVARAEAARKALAQNLMGRVMEVVEEDGFVAAVDVCHGEAPKITAETARAHEVRIGRTSSKLRNPKNLAPDWSEALFNPEGRPAIAIGPDDVLGIIHPIEIVPACVNCHGAPDQLAPGVAEILAERYPDDRATGYAVGDLRGWFWVEVPGS